MTGHKPIHHNHLASLEEYFIKDSPCQTTLSPILPFAFSYHPPQSRLIIPHPPLNLPQTRLRASTIQYLPLLIPLPPYCENLDRNRLRPATGKSIQLITVSARISFNQHTTASGLSCGPVGAALLGPYDIPRTPYPCVSIIFPFTILAFF